MPSLEKAYSARKNGYYALNFIIESFLGGPDLIRIASYFNNMQEVKDDASKASWQNRLRQQYKDWDQEVDKETMTALIENYAKQVKPEYLPDFYQTIEKDYHNDCRAYVEAMFKQTLLADTNCINRTYEKEQLEKDMALNMLKSVTTLGKKNPMRSLRTAWTSPKTNVCSAKPYWKWKWINRTIPMPTSPCG
ncbi:MAG: S46 family peptidase [Paraprevotella sp.]|nr:S46 family peptidase [Paraprevotella sp.]